MVLFEKYNLVSIQSNFISSIIKIIVVFAFPSQDRSPVKLICCVAFGSGSSAFCVLKSVAIVL